MRNQLAALMQAGFDNYKNVLSDADKELKNQDKKLQERLGRRQSNVNKPVAKQGQVNDLFKNVDGTDQRLLVG